MPHTPRKAPRKAIEDRAGGECGARRRQGGTALVRGAGKAGELPRAGRTTRQASSGGCGAARPARRATRCVPRRVAVPERALQALSARVARLAATRHTPRGGAQTGSWRCGCRLPARAEEEQAQAGRTAERRPCYPRGREGDAGQCSPALLCAMLRSCVARLLCRSSATASRAPRRRALPPPPPPLPPGVHSPLHSNATTSADACVATP